jgi:hypothetical protein
MPIKIDDLQPGLLVEDRNGLLYRVVGIFDRPSVILESVSANRKERLHVAIGKGEIWGGLKLPKA